jgi:protein Tex
MEIERELAQEFDLKLEYAKNIISLLDEGCTVPFIARYRKEMHGSCDDQVIREFADRLVYLRNLEKRKGEVEKSIKEQEKWTDELELALKNAHTLTEVEDIYRPYKPKRKTRASVAKEKGLEPLAQILLAQKTKDDINQLAKQYINANKGVKDKKEALQGALDIVAETISDDANLRKELRQTIFEKATIKCTLLENENSKTYEMYKNFEQEVKSLPSHRILAINRGEREKCLSVNIEISEKITFPIIEKEYLKDNENTKPYIQGAIEDSYERLLFPSLERECRTNLTDTANEQAIKMFEVNLKPLLLQSPLKDRVIMGFDPAYRTGCKIAVIDGNSDVLATTVVYPTPPQSKTEEAIEKLKALIEKYNVRTIAIGNGTASKESEIFVCELIKHCNHKVDYAMVNEAGASVYSASKLGAKEFPDFDVALRSAVSIARRLADPLAELIKIDVRSIGVGQYQHDMPQNRLKEVLDNTVEDCVNSVGVDLNTASPSLLTYVSGLNSSVAENIVEYRNKNKRFKSREELLKVAKLGPKAYEQAAGFLRVVGGENILDNTAVHPETYDATLKLLKMFDYTPNDITNNNLALLPQQVKQYGEERVAKEIGVGVPTLLDMIDELLKPGRDIRDELEKPELRSDILSMEDLKPDMILNGTVRNVIDFGAFVDIGVHQDGLVHISEISKSYIKHPSEVLKVGQKVKVKVIGVDLEKKRISLSIKQIDEESGQ